MLQTVEASPMNGINIEALPPISRELAFLKQYTDKEESQLLASALQLGLDLLYRQTLEEMFINGRLSRDEAVKQLSSERVQALEYARLALEQDVIGALSE